VKLEGHIGLAHGAGGPAMRALIAELLSDGEGEFPLDDGAVIPLGDRFLVVTTDSHVISPRFFPGGDIGRLSVAGTVNDLAVMGATEPLALTCAIVVEEGFELEELARIQTSIRATCREAGTRVVTGDTKVMGRGEVDGLVVNTTGLGFAERVVPTAGLRPGDRIVVSGTVGDHGLAILAVRNDLHLDADLRSDVAPLNGLVRAALEAGGAGVAALTDPTRGGLSGALHEMAAGSGVGIVIEDGVVPLSDAVRAAGELLGIDPLQVANEGKVVLGVRPEVSEVVLAALRAHPLGRDAAVVGTATADQVGRVILDTGFGRRLLTELDGEIAPRIC